MHRILGKRFRNYVDCFEHCGLFLLEKSDEVIEYFVFEEFIIDAHVYLGKKELDLYLGEWLIDDGIYKRSRELQRRILAIDGTSIWNVKSLRKDIEWREIMLLSDETKNQIHFKWTSKELEQIYLLD